MVTLCPGSSGEKREENLTGGRQTWAFFLASLWSLENLLHISGLKLCTCKTLAREIPSEKGSQMQPGIVLTGSLFWCEVFL